MKKIIVLVLVVLATISVFGCSGKSETMTIVVLETNEGQNNVGSVFFYTTQGENYAGDLGAASITEKTKLVNENGEPLSLLDILPGQLAQMTYSGVVQETYPLTYPEVMEIRVMGMAEDELYTLAKERRQEWQETYQEQNSMG